MSVIAIIPARLASTRLERKALQKIADKSMLQWVWEQASNSKEIDSCYIATDAEEIAQEIESFGGKYIMTDPEIASGSARVHAAIEILGEKPQIVVNVQGDMPFINPELIDKSILFFKENLNSFSMATVATPIYSEEDFQNPNKVKVVLGVDNSAPKSNNSF